MKNLIFQSHHATDAHIRALLPQALQNHCQNVSANYQVAHQVWKVSGAHDLDRDSVSAIIAASHAAETDCALVAAVRNLENYSLLAMDMDSTLITIECIDEIADMMQLKNEVAAITEAAMRGELDFDASLLQRVSLLKGLPVTALQRVADERLQLSPGADNLIRQLQAAGLKTLLVSGGFTFFTDLMAVRLDLSRTRANVLETADGHLTGKVIGTIINGQQKKQTVESMCHDLQITPDQAIVVGDGANDLDMMSVAGFSVAYQAKPVVRAKTSAALQHVGLDGILPLVS